MKPYTDLNQSRTLAEFLSHTTADQTWERIAIAGANLDVPEELQYRHNGNMPFKIYSGVGIPCWSLAALLDVLPKVYYPVKDHPTYLTLGKPKDKWCALYFDVTGMQDGEQTLADNLVDACYEMILKLKEQKLL